MATETDKPRTGSPRELATYRADVGERTLVGQRVDGVVRISDVPTNGTGRSYLVEPEIASMDELAGSAPPARRSPRSRRRSRTG